MKVLVLTFPNFNLQELSAIVRVLTSNGVEFEVVSTRRPIRNERTGQKVEIHRTLDEVLPDQYDALVCTSGSPTNRKFFWNDSTVKGIVQSFEGKPIAAICASVGVLAPLLEGRTVSCWPVLDLEILLSEAGATIRNSSLTIDNEIVTAATPEMARYWADAVVSVLKGEPVSQFGEYQQPIAKAKRRLLPWEGLEDVDHNQ
jgi:putative intracellular protease/amidase